MLTQNALQVTAVGKPLQLATIPIPQPGPNQVQLRVTVAGLNPHDQKARDHGLFIRNKNKLPAILANDLVGIVANRGQNVTKFNIGDRIVSQGDMVEEWVQSGLQQFAIADEAFAARTPDGVSDDEAATLPSNIIAGVVGLFDESGLGIPAPWTEEARTFDYTGTQLLIIGGGSNCGRFGVQLAKLAGIGKIVVLGGREDELKKYGATHVLDRHGGDEAVLERVRDVVGDDLVYALDAVNLPAGQHLGVNTLSNTKKGKLARLISSSALDETKVVPKKAGYEVKNVYGSSPLRAAVSIPFWERLGGYLEHGNIKPLAYVVEEGLSADKVNEVLDRYRDGKPVIQTHFHISK